MCESKTVFKVGDRVIVKNIPENWNSSVFNRYIGNTGTIERGDIESAIYHVNIDGLNGLHDFCGYRLKLLERKPQFAPGDLVRLIGNPSMSAKGGAYALVKAVEPYRTWGPSLSVIWVDPAAGGQMDGEYREMYFEKVKYDRRVLDVIKERFAEVPKPTAAARSVDAPIPIVKPAVTGHQYVIRDGDTLIGPFTSLSACETYVFDFLDEDCASYQRLATPRTNI